jgi:demethylmenaquinone methyltransferase/2-methoxy-6-polyprenyl-1,4-benzoquinol methylase
MISIRARDGRDPRELAALDMDLHLGNQDLKRKYVATMFDVLAPGYDAFSRLFSFGMDSRWKAELIAEGVRRASRHPRILDLACGTGDLGIELAGKTESKFALGLDLSSVMLSEAAARIRASGRQPLRLVAGDMGKLCVADRSVDVVSIGYGLRNTPDAAQSLREVARVLRPGGILLNLDFYKPASRVWREIFLGYLWHAGRLSGWLWHREPIVYGYVAHSIRRYLTMTEFEQLLRKSGFAIEWRASHLGGGIGLHAARRQ